MFLTGGVLGVPAGVYLLLQLPSGTYRHVIGGLLIVYAGYLLLRRPSRTLRTGPLSDACAGFLGGLTVYLSHAAIVLDADATRLENDHFHSSCAARRVVRMVHLQAPLGSAI